MGELSEESLAPWGAHQGCLVNALAQVQEEETRDTVGRTRVWAWPGGQTAAMGRIEKVACMAGARALAHTRHTLQHTCAVGTEPRGCHPWCVAAVLSSAVDRSPGSG